MFILLLLVVGAVWALARIFGRGGTDDYILSSDKIPESYKRDCRQRWQARGDQRSRTWANADWARQQHRGPKKRIPWQRVDEYDPSDEDQRTMALEIGHVAANVARRWGDAERGYRWEFFDRKLRIRCAYQDDLPDHVRIWLTESDDEVLCGTQTLYVGPWIDHLCGYEPVLAMTSPIEEEDRIGHELERQYQEAAALERKRMEEERIARIRKG